MFPTRAAPENPQRIVLILPCCIGDVVLATATLKALRRGYPHAHITWAVGSWSKPAIEHHPLLDAILDTGAEALPVKSLCGMWRFVRQLRAGNFDMAVSLVRSPLMSLAVLLSGIPYRVGLDSAGRGFGYNVRAKIDPLQARHEADIYLDTARVLGIDAADCWANIPVHEADNAKVEAKLTPPPGPLPVHREEEKLRVVVINPAGGRNPGMVMDSKRWPAANFAQLADHLAAKFGAQVIVLGGPNDGELVRAVQAALQTPALTFIGELTFGEIAALASVALCYIGNDTGLTHLAAAAGAKTVMILGPSDPARYAPFTPDSLALWKPASVARGGVADGAPQDWDWARDGISVEDVETKIAEFLSGV